LSLAARPDFLAGVPPLRCLLSLWLPVGLWLSVILSFSNDFASAQHTSRILGPLLAWLFPDWDEATRATAHFLVRKAAHLTEYGILAALLLRALRGSTVGSGNAWRWGAAFGTIAGCAAVASIDEIHQSFSSARTGTPWDVALDILGASFSVLLCWVFAQRKSEATPTRK